MLVVEIPYESQKNYAIFYLQFQRFLLLTSFGVLHPLPKGRGLARKIDNGYTLRIKICQDKLGEQFSALMLGLDESIWHDRRVDQRLNRMA